MFIGDYRRKRADNGRKCLDIYWNWNRNFVRKNLMHYLETNVFGFCSFHVMDRISLFHSFKTISRKKSKLNTNLMKRRSNNNNIKFVSAGRTQQQHFCFLPSPCFTQRTHFIFYRRRFFVAIKLMMV